MNIIVIVDENPYSEQVADTIIHVGKRYPDLNLIFAFLAKKITSQGKQKLSDLIERAKLNGISAQEDYVTYQYLSGACRYICNLAREVKADAIFVGEYLEEVVELLKNLCPEINLEVLKVFPFVGDVMTRGVVTAGKNTPISEIARLMKSHRIGSVIIEDNGKAIGIVTDSDLVRRVIAEDKDPKTTTAAEVMSSPLISASYDTELTKAAEIMAKNRIKRLPITKDDRVLGIVTVTDLTYNYPKIAKSVAASLYQVHRTMFNKI